MSRISPQELKEQYIDRNGAIHLLSSLGYSIDNKHKFKLRNEEKTPSAIVNKNGTIHDFGDGFHGDVFKVLQNYHDMLFKDAFIWVKEQFGIYDDSPMLKKESRDIFSMIRKEIDNFCKDDKKYCTFKNPDYSREALEIAPLWVYLQANNHTIKVFKQMTTFDMVNKTLVVKIQNYSGDLISYKRRRIANVGKWITRKDTHPNNQCMHYIVDDISPIYVVEGHHDYLTGILLNSTDEAVFNVFMVPTVNYHEFTKTEKALFLKREVVFLPDLSDKDEKGADAFTILGKQIEDIALSVAIVDLKLFLNECEGIDLNIDKLDLSDVVELSKEKDSRMFVNGLHYYSCLENIEEGGQND